MKTILLWLSECNNVSIIALLLEVGGNWFIGCRGIFKTLLNIYGVVFFPKLVAWQGPECASELIYIYHFITTYHCVLILRVAISTFLFLFFLVLSFQTTFQVASSFRIIYVLFPVGSSILAHFMPIFHFYTP